MGPTRQRHRKIYFVHHLPLMLTQGLTHIMGSVCKRSPNFHQPPEKSEEPSQKRVVFKLSKEALGNSAT